MTDHPDLHPSQPFADSTCSPRPSGSKRWPTANPNVAKGYGIRIAKIVASRRFGGAAKKSQDKKSSRSEKNRSATVSAARVARSSAPSTASCKRTRRSIARSLSAWDRSSTKPSFSRRFAIAHRRPQVRTIPGHDSQGMETCPKLIPDAASVGGYYGVVVAELVAALAQAVARRPEPRGEASPGLVHFRKPDVLVSERGNKPADDRPHPVDPPVGEVLLHQRRPKPARGFIAAPSRGRRPECPSRSSALLPRARSPWATEDRRPSRR